MLPVLFNSTLFTSSLSWGTWPWEFITLGVSLLSFSSSSWPEFLLSWFLLLGTALLSLSSLSCSSGPISLIETWGPSFFLASSSSYSSLFSIGLNLSLFSSLFLFKVSLIFFILSCIFSSFLSILASLATMCFLNCQILHQVHRQWYLHWPHHLHGPTGTYLELKLQPQGHVLWHPQHLFALCWWHQQIYAVGWGWW